MGQRYELCVLCPLGWMEMIFLLFKIFITYQLFSFFISLFFLNIRDGHLYLMPQLSYKLRPLHPISVCLVQVLAILFLIWLSTNVPGRQGWCLSYLGPSHPHGGSQLSSGPLINTWHISSFCRHLGTELEDGALLSLSVFLPPLLNVVFFPPLPNVYALKRNQYKSNR